MLKRAALARAIVMDPPLLFCDEPGAGLDPISLRSLDELILNLKDLLGITIVMVTHEVASIMRLANKIVMLKDGVVAFEGTPGEIRSTDYLYIKEFLQTDSKAES
jgi:phospholipid/cholesterol/gamma-HCH transport system ATP-binding protein